MEWLENHVEVGLIGSAEDGDPPTHLDPAILDLVSLNQTKPLLMYKPSRSSHSRSLCL